LLAHPSQWPLYGHDTICLIRYESLTWTEKLNQTHITKNKNINRGMVIMSDLVVGSVEIMGTKVHEHNGCDGSTLAKFTDNITKFAATKANQPA